MGEIAQSIAIDNDRSGIRQNSFLYPSRNSDESHHAFLCTH